MDANEFISLYCFILLGKCKIQKSQDYNDETLKSRMEGMSRFLLKKKNIINKFNKKNQHIVGIPDDQQT